MFWDCCLFLLLYLCVYLFLSSSFALSSTRSMGPSLENSLMMTFWNSCFMSILGISHIWSQSKQRTQSCAFVIPRPTTSYETTAFGRRLVISTLASFQKWVKFYPSLWLQAVNMALAPGPTWIWSHL